MRFLVSILVLLLAPPAAAQTLGLIEVPREHAQALADLDLMVEGGTPSRLRAHASAADRQALAAVGVPVTVLAVDARSLRPARSIGARGGATYHTPATMSASLRELVATYPDIARVVDLGTSVDGRELTGVVLSDQPDVRELDEPSWRILGTHHGDEWSSMEVAWAVAWDLAGAYDVDPSVTALLDSSEVWVLPVVNPDGVVAFTRRNSRNVDLNRNYGFEWSNQTYGGPAPFSEPESDAVRAMARTRTFGHSLSMHSGATNFGWVWNWSLAPTDDALVLEQMATRYLANNPQPDFWITNGAEWYVTYGDTNDWSYGARGGHDYTLEISLDKAPPEEELQEFLDWHVPATRAFLLDGASTGVAGVIGMLQGGVEATITSDLAPNAPFFTDPETGAFARPLSAGTHVLSIEAPGLVTSTRTVTVGVAGSDAASADASLVAVSPILLSGDSLTAPADSPEVGCLRGAGVLGHANAGGGFQLQRAGLGSWPLEAAVSGDCVALEIDPAVVPDEWTHVGEWTLVLADADGTPVDQRPLAVAITTPDLTARIDDVLVEKHADGWLVRLDGEDLPEGADLRFVGPELERRLPFSRLPDNGVGTGGVQALTAVVNVSDWSEGSWHIRVLGGGELQVLSDALDLDGAVLSSTFEPGDDDDDDDDDDTTADDDDTFDDDDSAGDDDDTTEPPPPPSGCSGCAGDPGSGTLGLLLLTPLAGLRRRRYEVPR